MNKRKIKKLVRFVNTAVISVIVILAMVITFSERAMIGAAEIFSNLPYSKSYNLTEKYDYTKSKTLYELTEYREHDKKTFINDQGLAELAIYGDAVHYLEDGEYKNIDNTLVYNNDSKKYSNTANFYKSSFPNNLKDNKIEIEYDDYKISFGINEVKNSTLHSIDKIKVDNKDLKQLSKVTSGVLYNEVQKNVDLQYTLKGQSIKEDIILKEYIENFTIVFEYELENLNLIENDGSYIFVNKNGELISEFTNLIMEDSKGNLSNDVNLNVSKLSDTAYKVTVTADDKFLKNASYPVVIDPTIDLSTNGLTIQSKYIRKNVDGSFTPSSDNPSDLNIGVYNYGKIENITYIGLANISNSITNLGHIAQARLNLKIDSTILPSGDCHVDLDEITNYNFSQIDSSALPFNTLESDKLQIQVVITFRFLILLVLFITG